MKVILAVALVALLVVAGVEAGRNGRHSKDKIKASSKTFVTQAGNVHRFCIPIGKKAAAVTEISLHVPRTSAGFSVKLDTSPARTFASPIGASDKFCDRFSSLFLVKSGVQTPNFLYAQSEIVKDGAIAGYVVGHRPEWIAVRIKGTGITSVPNCTYSPPPKHPLIFTHTPGNRLFNFSHPISLLIAGNRFPHIFSLPKIWEFPNVPIGRIPNFDRPIFTNQTHSSYCSNKFFLF